VTVNVSHDLAVTTIISLKSLAPNSLIVYTTMLKGTCAEGQNLSHCHDCSCIVTSEGEDNNSVSIRPNASFSAYILV